MLDAHYFYFILNRGQVLPLLYNN